MQKLSVKLKNTPGNTSPVLCSVSIELNSLLGVMDSVPCKVLTDNNSEENLLQPSGGFKTDMLACGGDKCPPL